MSSISKILRNQNNLIPNLTRGAKKKKGGAGKAQKEEVSPDLVNIFKDKKDNDIKPLREYPPWLVELTLPQSPPSVYYTAWSTDNDLYKPSSKDMVRFFKQSRREQLKDNNYQRAVRNKPLDEYVYHPYLKNLFMQAQASKDDDEGGEGEEEEEEEE